ncbi:MULTISPECIES: ABC transporter substrate-binding protein [Halanaerobium]|jgi:multiple sugar transport system substrate-binding protein|uniref:Carbohydrate ABC transporter substrate-binding protein (CUT1 family) n=1 Tax=Halanaerobium congolense TaxID=54121 RepID=A0A1G6QWN7_9FIRM|nr:MULTISPECIES: ABC transporter substrate-binding protein [Halanaerobium]PUU89583.1 MAG: multiple sugar transport system substrate-binding protein [Halanaerobium sp.]PUU90352.1 MAG: multiple sugar transport system substrate-binding protein [Halanaerobium sp.]PXV64204.1 carbohydrate ABC transporter substrate-binding protein (CUT1 family) [Halanaerobium congolense]TDS28637.1 carbohydrate ABC transporter substrate-binding protein (CUT1 family) [Halanaerobium congolense]SDC96374.1 carbohydrate AB
MFNKKSLLILTLVILFVGVFALSTSAETIKMISMKQAGWTPEEYNQIIAEFEEDNPGVEVELTLVGYDALHDKLITSISGANPAYDVVLIDDIWYAQFAEAGWLLDVTDRVSSNMKDDVYDKAWEIVGYNERLYGLPWLLDLEYFFYNEQILNEAGIENPPTTWEEVVEQSKIIKEKGIVEYPMVWSWAQIEALICDWVTLLKGNNGEFFDENNKPAFNNEEGIETLTWMKETIDSGLTNPASLSANEEEVRRIFSQGNAAFTINWVYMYELLNNPDESNIVGQTQLALMPVFEDAKAEGIESASITGSMGFSVTKNSSNEDLAYDLIEFMTSKDIQTRYADHVTPMYKSVMKQEEIIEMHPETFKMFDKQFPYIYSRPKVPYYTEVSRALQTSIQNALVGNVSPQEALDNAAEEVEKIQERW